MKISLPALIFLLIGLLVVSGCSRPESVLLPQAELHGHIESKAEVSLGLGCYYSVTGYVYNSGTGPANTASINLNLIDTNSGTIRDSKSINLGYIGKGESKNFETTLDGDCGHTYRIDSTIP